MAWSLNDTMTLLAFAADAGLTTLTGNSETDSLALYAELVATEFPRVQKYAGEDWTLVWGPVVISKFDPVELRYNIVNTLYVAQQNGTSTYVIGTAGTDFRSAYDWVIEDLQIKPVPWPYSNAGTIGAGAMTGLSNLQLLTPFGGTPQPGVTLYDFLPQITTSPITLYVTGHSLGGALTEVVALWLADTQGANGTWDPSSNATIVPISFAGPTPGDTAWMTHFDDVFGNTSGAARVWNTNDVVPHAWNATQMEQIETLYGTVSPPNDLEKLAIKAAVHRAKNHDFQQVLGGGTTFTGTIQGSLSFGAQLLYQHVDAYYAAVGVSPPSSLAVASTTSS